MPDEFMTCVFPMDVRDYHGNPHQAMTPFGQAQIVSRGNLAAKCDALEEQIDALVEALEGLLEDDDLSLHGGEIREDFPNCRTCEFVDKARTVLAKAKAHD